MTPVRLEPAALRSRVKHSTTEPLRSLVVVAINLIVLSADNLCKQLGSRSCFVEPDLDPNCSV